MDIKLNKKNGVPLYIQVKKQIKDLIVSGNLMEGHKMPTERELSSKLNVSRNTVSSAYKELELEGVLKSLQGKGTFVAERNKIWQAKEVKDKIFKLLDLAFEEAIESGIDSDNFINLINNHIHEKIEKMNKTTAVYVECNVEQSRMFSRQLSEATKLNVVPVTINDLKNMEGRTKKVLESSQIIVATFNHVHEVARLTSNYKKEILGVAINADLGTIVKIARYPDNTRFALFCISEEFMFKIQQALDEAGLGNIKIKYTNTFDNEEVIKVMDECDVILVSPGRYNDIQDVNVNKKDIIKFIYNLDDGSVKALKSKIVDLNVSM
ncbi:GntR family transcriptional regulator [Clostridium polynesiense]|uniref:GntR family transcriptional regulator n=1 Tax=Clostridium polynesiense TaxID=1325933 RepID=UPI0006946F37|nr:GntR family transcriptional regulator [Clostridium polynesiense]